jgi:hypothetical protein
MIDEPVNQIGSFIWTHLTNIQESDSKDEWKMQLKNIIGIDFIRNKWNSDVRKFSRNIEMSYHSKDLQMGGTLDSNIIFSEKSYIPRSTTLNLTANLFGENINLLELGGRVEGFEDIVENFFGPEGYFREDNFHKLLQSLRPKRDIVEDSVKPLQTLFGQEIRKEEPRGNFYIRLFGIDIYYNSFLGISSLFKNVVMKPLDYLGFSFGENELEFRKSSIFLDGSIIVPTGLGIPLNLTVNGTSHVNLKSTTKLKFSELFSFGKTHLKAQIYPTVSLQISAMMSVDAFFAKTGLKSISKFHTSAYFDAHADIQNGKIIKMNVNLPTEKIDLFEASADLFTYKEGEFIQQKSIHKKEYLTKCSSESTADILGLRICSEGYYYHGNYSESPEWYFTGPSLAAFYLEKIDSLEKISLEYSWSRDLSKPDKGIVDNILLALDTPGSKVKRGFSSQLKFDDIKTFFLVEIRFPVWNTSLELRYDWSLMRKIIKGSITVEGFDVIVFTQQLEKQEKKFEALCKLVYWGNKVVDWQGTVHIAPNKQSLAVKLRGNFHEPVDITGDFIKNENNIQIIGNFTTNGLSLNYNGKCHYSESLVKSTGIVTYFITGQNSGIFELSGKVQKIQQGMLKRHIISISAKVRQFLYFALTNEKKFPNPFETFRKCLLWGKRVQLIYSIFCTMLMIYHQNTYFIFIIFKKNSPANYLLTQEFCSQCEIPGLLFG